MPAGVALVISSALWGLLWRNFRPKFKEGTFNYLELYSFGILVSVSMLVCIWLLLPPPEGPEVLRAITLPVLLIFPVATLLLGYLLGHQKTNKEISQEIQQNEENLRQMLQNMPVMLDAFDKDDNIIAWNKECERVTGYRADEIINNPNAMDMLYPDTQRLANMLEDYRVNEVDYRKSEYTLTAKDGSKKTIAWTSRYQGVDIPGWHSWAIGVDITERKKAVQALQESEARFRRIVETAEEGIWMIDTEDNTTYVNKKMANMLGYSVQEMVGTNLFSFLKEQEQLKFKRRKKEIAGQDDFCFMHKHGHEVWTIISTTPILEEGQYQGGLAMITDITQRKQIEEKLHLFKERLQKSQEIGLVGSWEYNIQTGEIWGSDEGFHIYGLEVPPDNALPIDIIESLIPERKMVHQALVNLINDGKPYDLEFEIRPPHGQFTIITSKAELIKDDQGNPLKVVGVIQDVTQRWQAEKKVKQLNTKLEERVLERTAQLQSVNKALESAIQTRDSFLANMSHELRTPLTAILGMSEILTEQLRGPLNDVQMKYVKTIHSSGEHLLQLINDILELSKLEAQQITLTFGEVDLQFICNNSLQFIQPQIEEKELEAILSIETKRTTIEADPRRLKQILLNLLSNAVKFTPSGGKIGLTLKDAPQNPDRLQFIVWDTGIGITPENQEKLFKPFVQVESELNRRYEGTGLGLVLVDRFTALHHGEVKLDSKLGEGTQITVSLPVSQNESA